MLALLDMVRNENQMYINKGKVEGMMEVARKLLKENFSIQKIANLTGLKIEEIEKLK